MKGNMIMLNQPNNAMDIVADILANEEENTIASYQYNGIELTQAEPVTMRNTLLLTIFNPDSFLILRASKNSDVEYDEFQALLERQLAQGITHNDKKYHVLGASSSLKDGKLWMATVDVIESIHCYFESAQEALAYLGIYTSNNNHGIYEVEHQIKVVDDGYQVEGNLITGDGAAGIENAGPHTLRKTAGAFYYMATRDIYATKEWMGHSDISITINHYSGLMQTMKREDDLAFEKLLTAQLEGQL